MTLAQAKKAYPHRFTMEHVPNWARNPAPNGKYYAPQFRTDAEWHANTLFPPNNPLGKRVQDCFTNGQTWPLGQWLDKPFTAR